MAIRTQADEVTLLINRLMASERMALVGQATAQVASHLTSQLTILPLIQLMERQYTSDPELVEFLEVLREAFHTIHETVQQMRRVVKIESSSSLPESVSLSEIVREVTRFLRFQKNFPWSRIHLDLRHNSKVLSHRSKLFHILSNLLFNAADAIEGDPNGMITVRVQPESQGFGTIVVEDNGRGIPAEHLSEIWKPDFSTKPGHSHGLGLHLVKSLVTSDHGQIDCVSVPEVRTVFTIRMPASSQPLDEQMEERVNREINFALSRGTSGTRLFSDPVSSAAYGFGLATAPGAG